MTTIDIRTACPILEFDPSPAALIEPSGVLKPQANMPESGVLCFFQEIIDKTCRQTNAPVVYKTNSEIGSNPIYSLPVGDRHIAVMHPGVGAPLAGAFLEEIIALGCRRIIVVGGAGVLNRELTVGHVVIPTSAVRDEGTSYHYLPPGREAAPSDQGVEALRQTLEHHHIPYTYGKTWTTDAIYRETPAKIARRRDEGCIVVEMEAAALFAIAQFRGITLGQLLYGGDDVSGDQWDHRDWITTQASTREKLFWLAAEASLKL